ncbi:hypothetical protein ACGFYY_02855 [Streptomyces sp. NPDC048331]|uniref:hypothetical protein n=1 Tax=Streptomyces sp. NPDC048331 TaxID=3365534 RepID=UPI0037128DCC
MAGGQPTAPRLGRKLVTEVPASRPGRRAFVDASPTRGRSDDRARDEGRVREDRGRVFGPRHREYDGERIDGFDHDIGAADQAASRTALTAWGLRPDAFLHPWETDDPE